MFGFGIQTWAVIALGSALVFFVYEYDSRGRQIASFEKTTVVLQNRLKVAKKNTSLANQTIKILSDRDISKDKDLAVLCKIYNKIDATPTGGDPVGGVLEGLKGLETGKKVK